MKHCINNNYSFAGFWRLWHATLNKWIIRYMFAANLRPSLSLTPQSFLTERSFRSKRYVPLGGKRAQIWSMWIIFTFVGLWHDLWCARTRRMRGAALKSQCTTGGAGSRGRGSIVFVSL